MLRRFTGHCEGVSKLSLQSLVVLLFFLPSTCHAADSQKTPQPKSLDPHIRQVLPTLLNRGADLFNSADLQGCCRLYESTLLVLRPVLADQPRLRQTIDEGLVEARKKADDRERALTLRAVLDSIHSEVSARKKETPKAVVGFTLDKEEQAILDLTNAERQKAGLTALKANEKLFQVARAHSANMARQEMLSHTLDSEGPDERLRKVGYASATWGENCAAGQRKPEEAVSSWMGSEGHRKNILSQQYSEIGIGIAVSEGGTRYYTQVFGKPAGQ